MLVKKSITFWTKLPMPLAIHSMKSATKPIISPSAPAIEPTKPITPDRTVPIKPRTTPPTPDISENSASQIGFNTANAS
jgi:hypothetical protein